MKKMVTELKGSNGKVTHVVLNDGTELKADLVIVGAGVVPSTSFLQNIGLSLD